MNIHISDANFNFQFPQKLNGHNIHSPSGTVYCWSIHFLYLHPAQENHAQPHLPCSVYFRMTTKCRDDFGLFFPHLHHHIGSKKLNFFSYSLFPVTLAVKNWKIDLFSIFHVSRMVIRGSLLKLHPKLKAELEHSCVDNYPVQSLIDSIIHSIVQSVIQSIVQSRAQLLWCLLYSTVCICLPCVECGSPWLLRILYRQAHTGTHAGSRDYMMKTLYRCCKCIWPTETAIILQVGPAYGRMDLKEL